MAHDWEMVLLLDSQVLSGCYMLENHMARGRENGNDLVLEGMRSDMGTLSPSSLCSQEFSLPIFLVLLLLLAQSLVWC